MEHDQIVKHYLNENKSAAQICNEFRLTKKRFYNLCKKFNIVKSAALKRQALANSGAYTIQEFIDRAISLHGKRYDYSLVRYSRSSIPVKILCPEHGEFMQKPVLHLQGYGCQKCGGSITLTQVQVLVKAKEVHDDKYDYSKVQYRNMHTKIIIICPEHGEFLQKPVKHLSGQGCPRCTNVVRLTTTEFITKAKKVHGDKFDYSLVRYTDTDTKVKIICPKHGVFETTPYLHLRHDCQECALSTPGNPNYRDAFIKRAREVLGDKYDYSLVKYYNSYKHVQIICPEHGIFEQAPYDHLQGKGCQKCAGNVKITTAEFVKRAIQTHGDKYDYSQSVCTGAHTKVAIICKKHGLFEQTANSHYMGYDCPKCPKALSDGQKEIAAFLNIANLCYNDRSIINPREIDLYIPSLKLGIEYHGIYWHSYDRMETPEERNKHKFKQDLCEKKGIRLIQVFEHEWQNKQEIIKSRLNVFLNRCSKIYARNCSVAELSATDFNLFCASYHLQGGLYSQIRYGLMYDNKIMMVMGFNIEKDGYKCTRICSVLNTVVVGGASKLFNAFRQKYKPATVITFADRRFSMGNIYKKLGFELLYATQPNYFYVKSGKVFSRMKFQKHKQIKSLELFDANLSEAQNMFMNGYRRLWDAGHLKYVLN